MNASLPNLFSAVEIGPCSVPNRIVFCGHHTYLAERVPSDALIAYLEARARGGAGLIVSEIVAVHPSAGFAPRLLVADHAEVVPHYRRLAAACHAHGAVVFAQLFHPGREILSSPSGMAPLAWAPSASPNERFHIMPRPLTRAMVESVIRGYATAASHLAAAGFDGFEIVANHGYLPAQFLNPRINRREDEYGGDFPRRLRFLREVAAAVRERGGGVLGLRISADELDHQGLTQPEILTICEELAAHFDYYSVVLGTSSSLGGSVHIAPPMGVETSIAPFAQKIREATGLTVIATGRITRPEDAEHIIATGAADLCGMTRAMICDAQMASKALAGRFDHIRECIGCNQSCIGRAHKGLGISCIQHPESGRELQFGMPLLVGGGQTKRVVVAGGGVAGMKAAAVAAQRGYEVVLFEKNRTLGGQSRLAMRLPGRAAFGGIITNLEREMRAAGVEVRTAVRVDGEMIARLRNAGWADCVVVATGAMPYIPDFPGVEQNNVVSAWEIITGAGRTGGKVAVADWKGDWVGLGIAEMLAAAGCRVSLCVNAALAGEALQLYTRNYHVARVRKLGVCIQTHLRLFGVDRTTVYFQDVLTGEPVVLDGIDTLVLALGHRSDNHLERELADGPGAIPAGDLHVIGDGLLPRTAEEAVYEGMTIGREI